MRMLVSDYDEFAKSVITNVEEVNSIDVSVGFNPDHSNGEIPTDVYVEITNEKWDYIYRGYCEICCEAFYREVMEQANRLITKAAITGYIDISKFTYFEFMECEF